MRFTPKTEEEVANIIPEGRYKFIVEEAADKVSKSGNEMIELKLRIHGPREKIVFDYLLEVMDYKLRHFCDAADLLHKYDNSSLMATDCIGKSGECLIVIDDKNISYPPKNAVKDYIKKSAKAKGAGIGAPKTEDRAAQPEEFFNDDLPF